VTSTRPAATTTVVNTVLSAQTGPRGGAAGASALPSTGQGRDNEQKNYLPAVVALAVGGVALVSAVNVARRRRWRR
jgi:hypothetical protein